MLPAALVGVIVYVNANRRGAPLKMPNLVRAIRNGTPKKFFHALEATSSGTVSSEIQDFSIFLTWIFTTPHLDFTVIYNVKSRGFYL